MRKIYFVLLLACTMVLSGQETKEAQTVKQETPASFKLYPNPAFNDVVYVTTQKKDLKDIVVYDVFGEVVLRDRITTNALNISRLVPGVYVLQLTQNETTMNRKLVVK